MISIPLYPETAEHSAIFVCDGEYASAIIESACDENGNEEFSWNSTIHFPFGEGANYVVQNPDGSWTSICNDDGNAWCDDWKTFEEAIQYIHGEIDEEGFAL